MLLENAYIWVEAEAPTLVGSYADLVELEQCLEALYKGTLDDVPDLTRLYLPLEQLIPGKPLLSQLDSATVRRALYALDEVERTAIELRFNPLDPELEQTLAHHFVHSAYSDYFTFETQVYRDALLHLGDAIWQLL